METDRDVSRRGFLRAAAGTGVAGATVGAGATGTAMAQEAPYDGYLSDADNFDGTTADMTGQDEVTISVGAEGNGGGFAFDPPAVQVDPGTSVVWEWTGEGGSHNVVDEGGAFESELTGEEGFTFEQTFEEEGVVKYFCQPHKGLGMVGVVAVGDTAEEGSTDSDGAAAGDGGDGTPSEDGGDGTPSEDGGDGGDGDSGGGGGGGAEPDLGGYLDGVGNFDGTVVDARGQEEVTVGVGTEANGGNFGFGPPAVHIDSGATVVWEWTGEGGSHNVVDEGGAFESELTGEEGFTFERTFEEDGIFDYFCRPHKSLGMKGQVVVGDDIPTVGGEGNAVGPSPLPGSVKTLGVATSFVLAATLGLAYMFVKYGGNHGDVEA